MNDHSLASTEWIDSPDAANSFLRSLYRQYYLFKDDYEDYVNSGAKDFNITGEDRKTKENQLLPGWNPPREAYPYKMITRHNIKDLYWAFKTLRMLIVKEKKMIAKVNRGMRQERELEPYILQKLTFHHALKNFSVQRARSIRTFNWFPYD